MKSPTKPKASILAPRETRTPAMRHKKPTTSTPKTNAKNCLFQERKTSVWYNSNKNKNQLQQLRIRLSKFAASHPNTHSTRTTSSYSRSYTHESMLNSNPSSSSLIRIISSFVNSPRPVPTISPVRLHTIPGTLTGWDSSFFATGSTTPFVCGNNFSDVRPPHFWAACVLGVFNGNCVDGRVKYVGGSTVLRRGEVMR